MFKSGIKYDFICMIKIPYTNNVVKVPKKIVSNLSKIEMVSGRCAMIGMYNIACPAHSIIFPILEIGATILLSDNDSKSAKFSILNSFESPQNDTFSYTFHIKREQEIINGRAAMLGIAFIFCSHQTI